MTSFKLVVSSPTASKLSGRMARRTLKIRAKRACSTCLGSSSTQERAKSCGVLPCPCRHLFLWSQGNLDLVTAEGPEEKADRGAEGGEGHGRDGGWAHPSRRSRAACAQDGLTATLKTKCETNLKLVEVVETSPSLLMFQEFGILDSPLGRGFS